METTISEISLLEENFNKWKKSVKVATEWKEEDSKGKNKGPREDSEEADKTV